MPSHSVNDQQYDALLRQSRLAAPPLDGVSHLSPHELASFAPPATVERQGVVLQSVTATILTLCTTLANKLHTSHPLGPQDSAWFRDLFLDLAERMQKMSQGNWRMKERFVRAMDSKLRADVEEQMRHKSAHVRTVGGFILQTLQELLRMLEKGEQVPHDFLWKDVASLECIDRDMTAWIVYCDDPTNEGWQRIMARRERSLEDFNRRIASRRGFSYQHWAKPEFQVGSRQASS
ncbi:hypothetical protein NBRC10513v2_000848 [Rhodotorula toruloides]